MSFNEITVAPEAHGFGAKITGVDLTRAMPSSVLAEVRAAWARHSVVYFPDQDLDNLALEAFSRQIGPFGDNPYVEAMVDHPNILEVRREANEVATNFGAGWHSDWSFQENPPSATILLSKVTPPVGGDTHYADCARAYEALSDVMKNILAGLYTRHSAAVSYGSQGFFAKDDTPRTMNIISTTKADESLRHPLVRRHPENGRDVLFINHTYTVAIEGMHSDESKALLSFLYDHITKDEFIYKHRWQRNMLVMWDNRSVLHSAQGGYDGYQRIMHRTVVAGEKPILATA